MWRKLNKLMRENSMEKPNFKGFMANSARAN
jgi:thymidylate kinase